MLTIEDIRKKAIAFPDDKPVEELIDEIVLMYKVQQGLKEAAEGKAIPFEDFKSEMELWWKSK